MDVLESTFSRLSPNWWYLIHPPESTNYDNIWPYLPFNNDFFIHTMKEADLLSRNALKKDEFNRVFREKFEVTGCKRGSVKMIYIRRSGEGAEIAHRPQNQDAGVVDMRRSGLYIIRPHQKRFHLGSVSREIVSSFMHMHIYWGKITGNATGRNI